MLAQIVEMVGRGRSGAVRRSSGWPTRWPAWFVPVVVASAVLTFVAWTHLGPPSGGSRTRLVNAVAVLIIACPCALGLATPMSIMVGVGRGANEGVLIKDAAALEALEQVDTLVVDKTGTLTEGQAASRGRRRAAGTGLAERRDAAARRVGRAEQRASARPRRSSARREGARLTLGRASRFQSVTGRRRRRARWTAARCSSATRRCWTTRGDRRRRRSQRGPTALRREGRR